MKILISYKSNKMAFGTFFKKIITGAKNIISKAAPIIRKGLDVASKIAPVVGNAIGGPIGGVINQIGSTAGKIGNYMDKSGLSQGRFDAPILKPLGYD